MAYQTGTVENSHSLVERIYGFMLENGWSLRATLKSGGLHDYVFYSSGEFGLDDVYIRVAAGEADTQPMGDIQHPYSDGYTEYINAFAYQWFPSDGTSGKDGYNELGKYGPILYTATYTSSTTSGWANETSLLDYSKRNLVVDFLDSANYDKVAAFDGKRYIYQYTLASALERGDLYNGETTNRNIHAYYNVCNTSAYVVTDKDWIYNNISTLGFVKFDVDANTWYTGVVPAPPWGSSTYYGSICTGVRRHRGSGNYWLYAFRGSNYKHWSQMDLETETWSGYNLDTPWGVTPNNSYRAFSLFVTKEQSGYDNDRIYLFRGGARTDFASIAIDDYGQVLSGASWAIHANTILEQRGGLHATCVNGRIICTGTSTGTGKSVYEWELPEDPEGAGSWSLSSLTTQYNYTLGPFLFHTHDHLCGRVKISENQTNTYWLFLDKNRLVVVVKNADGEYNYFYAGRFRPYANQTNAILLSDALAGSTSIEVSNPALFEEGATYMISETTGSYPEFSYKLLLPSETFTVTTNDGSGTLIISELSKSYGAGSKVGEDPTPVTVRVHSIEKAQTFDIINLSGSDNYSDPAWQTYSLTPTVVDDFANATDIDGRSGSTFLYAMVLLSEGDSDRGKEVRGQLIDVYSCGTSIASEEEVKKGSKIYIAFDISESGHNQRIVVGPTN